MLDILPMVLGPAATNAYLIADTDNGETVVIDPAWDGQSIVSKAQASGWHISQIWITHAHFDHFGGIGPVLAGSKPAPSIALHPADIPLWRMKGGADLFGIQMEFPPQPDILLQSGHILQVGQYEFRVRHTPGHSLGHVLYYCEVEGLAFVGDTIFSGSIGRTDLPGGDEETLIESIQQQILTLPPETRLLCGHGEETWVDKERRTNPYLVG